MDLWVYLWLLGHLGQNYNLGKMKPGAIRVTQASYATPFECKGVSVEMPRKLQVLRERGLKQTLFVLESLLSAG